MTLDFRDLVVVLDGFGQPQAPERVDRTMNIPVRWLGPSICLHEDTGACLSRAS